MMPLIEPTLQKKSTERNWLKMRVPRGVVVKNLQAPGSKREDDSRIKIRNRNFRLEMRISQFVRHVERLTRLRCVGELLEHALFFGTQNGTMSKGKER